MAFSLVMASPFRILGAVSLPFQFSGSPVAESCVLQGMRRVSLYFVFAVFMLQVIAKYMATMITADMYMATT